MFRVVCLGHGHMEVGLASEWLRGHWKRDSEGMED